MSWRGARNGSRTDMHVSRRNGSRQRRLLVIAGAAFAALLAVPAQGAQVHLSGAGETVPVSDLDEIDCEPSPTELEDIAFIAEQDGIPLDEAIARYGWQGCFGEVTSYLTEAYADQYAGAAIIDDGRRAWIAFKGEIPEEVPDLVEAIPATVELITGRGFSEVELNETLQSVYRDISNHDEVAAANGSYDIATGVITIHAQPLQTLTDHVERDRLRERLVLEQPTNTAISIDVIVVDELGGADDESSDGTRRLAPVVSAGLLTAGVLALLAGLLIRRKRLA